MGLDCGVFGLLLAIILGSFLVSPASALYTASLSVDDSVSVSASSSVNNGVSVYNESVNVITNCTAGYNLTLATSGNSTLYLDGNSANNTSVINAVNSSYALSDLEHNANTWGYSLTGNPGVVGAFSPLSSTPSTIKTISETATELTGIDDTFSIYFGTTVNSDLASGSYSMSDNGALVYHLTIAPSCTNSVSVTFNENLDGAGAEGTDNTIASFPTTSDNTIDTANNTITLSNKRPTRTGYIFKEWNTEADGTGAYYKVGETVPTDQNGLSGSVVLYAIWVPDCATATICYNGNHADGGSMTDQAATNGSDITFIASNFNRDGYGFAGWNTEADGTGTNYGPNQTITMPASGGLTLFANWLKPSGTLQTWDGASNMSVGDVIALRDNRDDEVYAVAKLADNKVWIVENLRLVPNAVSFTAHNTNNPTTDFIEAAPSSFSTTSQCSENSTGCDDQIYYYTGNMNRSATQSPTGNDSANAWYSYGTMYNWYTVTAGHGSYESTASSGPNNDGTMAGDICPAGWHLPTGTSSGEYNALATAVGGTGKTGAVNLRKYPTNFIFSGDYNPQINIPDGRGTQGRLWHSTAANKNNAYRMGYNSTSITPINTYNKWDNFAVRCIFQGGNVHYAEVTVDFAGTGVASVTFENDNYNNVTATPSNPTVELAENAAYTIVANLNTGYELASWATTSGATLASASANPTTYTVAANEATLTVTGAEIPSYEVTVNLGEHVSSISFTNATYGIQTVTNDNVGTNIDNGEDTGAVSLRRGVEYTLTSSYEAGYSADTWTTTANGTLGSTTSNSTTYVITGTATLSLTAQEANELNYTLIYSAGSGTDAPDSDVEIGYNDTYNFTITNSAPIYYGYTFTGWSETADANNNGITVDYTSGNTITVASTGASTTKTLYPVYVANSCPSGKICYYDNGADVNGGGRGTMSNKSASSNASVNLVPSNYSKSGYGFAGWAVDSTTTPYGPNATITTPDLSSTGLALYARWVKSVGDLQTWSGCSTLMLNNVTALTDARDNNTYAVAKLADDNCWLIENLRLDPGTANITTQNTNNPTNTFITESNAGSGASLSVDTMCNNDNNEDNCIDSIQYNSNSTNRSLTQSYTANTNSTAWYSYGTYYNWYTATAGNGTYSSDSSSGPDSDGTVAGDICPKKWRLPTGNSTGEYNTLNTAVNGGNTGDDAGLRAYPVNFLWSGDYNNTNRKSSYSNGRIWTATAKDNATAYRVGFSTSTVTASTNTYNKWDGFVVRCIYNLDTVDYHDVVVTFPQNVTSVSFASVKYGIQTATPSNATVSLAEGATYTITATFASGYTFGAWTNGANSTIGSAAANPTTFSVVDDSMLTLTVEEIPGYIIQYDGNGANNLNGMGTTDSSTGIKSVKQTNIAEGAKVTLLASNFKKDGYGFLGWSTDIDAWTHFTDNDNTNDPIIYGPMEDVIIDTNLMSEANDERIITMHAVWVPAKKDGNNNPIYLQEWDNPTDPNDGCAALVETTFNDNIANEKDKITVNKNSIIALTDKRDNMVYAIAKLADNNCWMIENLRLDDQYTMGQNQNDSSVTNASLAQGYGGTTGTYGNFVGLANSESANFSDSTTSNSVYKSSLASPTDTYNPINNVLEDIGTTNLPRARFPRYNNNNTNDFTDGATYTQNYSNANALPISSGTYSNANLYSYGNYYAWSAAMANTNYYANAYSESANTSICPTGWHLPSSGSTNKEFGTLSQGYGGTGNIQDDTTNAGDIMSNRFRSFPNNFLYSGYFNNSSASSRGVGGYYWSRSAITNLNSYYFGLIPKTLSPSLNSSKSTGRSVRCLIGP